MTLVVSHQPTDGCHSKVAALSPPKEMSTPHTFQPAEWRIIAATATQMLSPAQQVRGPLQGAENLMLAHGQALETEMREWS